MTTETHPKRTHVHTPKNFVFYLAIKGDDPIYMEWRGLPKAVAKKMYNVTSKKMRMSPDMQCTYGWEESK